MRKSRLAWGRLQWALFRARRARHRLRSSCFAAKCCSDADALRRTFILDEEILLAPARPAIASARCP